MGGSRLEIAGRMVVRSEAGELDAEYAIFEPEDLETGIVGGSARELGYRTTVAKARMRLGYVGVTETLAHELADELRPVTEAYARGPVVRRIAKLLGAAELFEGAEYDLRGRTYLGLWLDLPALSRDLGLPGASAALQALYLAALLAEAPADQRVMIHTVDLAIDPGKRTYKGIELEAIPALALAIRTLVRRGPPPTSQRIAGLSHGEVLAAIHERKAFFAHAAAQVRLGKIEQAASEREQPTQGLLAKPEPIKATPDLEPTAKFQRAAPAPPAHGPPPNAGTPSSAPQMLAWTQVHDDDVAPDTVIEPAPVVAVGRNPTVQQIVHVPQPPSSRMPSGTPAPPKSAIPPSIDPNMRASVPYSAISGERSTRTSSRPRRPSVTPATASNGAHEPNSSDIDAPPRESIAPVRAQPTTPGKGTPNPAGNEPTLPEPVAIAGRTPSDAPTREERTARPSSRRPGVVESRSAGWSDSRAEPDEPASPPQSQPGRYMAGASQPPFRSGDGREVRSPMPSGFESFRAESAEHLSLPSGASADLALGDANPRTIPEARALFTQLSRELGREYRVERGIELYTDVGAIEAMQAHLFAKYFGHKVRSVGDWYDVRRHGAFLSEILARTIGAEWTDIRATALGYWVMTIPNGTRISPFARVLRYLTMGPRERDLVSYYLELRYRTTGR